ncbi:MAG: sigma-70 family RNA polymerase sigma factor [Eubacteriales bacterium]|nr:sigma-70 family RNA polymerase sigma factor [Eubacteriales bacterium]
MMKEKAFNKIYDMFCGTVEMYAKSIVGDTDFVEDICQEVFRGFYAEMDNLDCTDLKYIRSWLIVAAKYRTYDYVRVLTKNRGIVERAIEAEKDFFGAIEFPSPEEIFLGKEEVETRVNIIREFRRKYPREFEMLIQVEYNEEKPEAVARRNHITVNNLYTKIYRLRGHMRTELSRKTM